MAGTLWSRMWGAPAVMAVLAAAAPVPGLAGCAPSAPAFRTQSVPHGSLENRGGVWVMVLRGTPEERGTAAGLLVGEQVRWALPRYFRAVFGAETPPPRVLDRVRFVEPHVPADHLAQAGALATAAGVTRDAVLAANLAPDLKTGMACSCLAIAPSRSPDGRVRLARNLDWPGGDVLADLGLVVVEEGAAHRFASFTWPGLVGVATGLNDAGLAAADLVVPGQRTPMGPGVPVLFAVRQVLESAASVDEAAALLGRIPRTVAQNYALADPSGAAVLETGSRRFVRRDPGSDGFVAVANSWDEDRLARPGSRYARMVQAAAAALLGEAGLLAVLRDVAIPDLNVQAALIDPAARRVLISTHARPAAGGPFDNLDLSPWLGPVGP
jgi:hypothetical protein